MRFDWVKTIASTGAVLLVGSRNAAAETCDSIPAAFEEGYVNGLVTVTKTAPNGAVTIDAQGSFHDAKDRGLRYFWCTRNKSYFGTEAPKDGYSSDNYDDETSPTGSPVTMPPTVPPTLGCPNTELNTERCGYEGIPREECWAKGCCFDPANPIQCYPVKHASAGRRVLQNEDVATNETSDYYYYTYSYVTYTDYYSPEDDGGEEEEETPTEKPKEPEGKPNTGDEMELDGLPPSCVSGRKWETQEPVLELTDVMGEDKYEIELHVADAHCGDLNDLVRTFEVDTVSEQQCPSYELAPPGSRGSCYCADMFMVEGSCPTCAVTKNLCPAGFVYDLLHDQCILDTTKCILGQDAVVDRDRVVDRDVDLYPAYPNRCLPNSKSPTKYPSTGPTYAPTTGIPSQAPSHAPTGAPVTPNPTMAPIVNYCGIIEGNDAFVKEPLECQLPFTYKKSGKTTVYDYPPLLQEAGPFVGKTGVDKNHPTNRWCPPKGMKLYNFDHKASRSNWGVATCEHLNKLPTISPTNAPSTMSPTSTPTTETPTAYPSRAPSTRGPSKSPTYEPTGFPSSAPTNYPTVNPTMNPTRRPTKATPTTSTPTTKPTASHGCIMEKGNEGFDNKEQKDCQIPFTYRRGGVDVKVDYAPQIGDFKPFGVVNLGLDMNDPAVTAMRWCPPYGTSLYVFDGRSKKMWGIATCKTTPPPRPQIGARPGDMTGGCVAKCRVGYRFDDTIQKCRPIVDPTCHDQHYYNPSSCSVRRCGFDNSSPLTMTVFPFTITADMFGVKLVPNVHWVDVESASITWTLVPLSKYAIANHTGSRPATDTLYFEVGPSLLLPGERFQGVAKVVDKCGRSISTPVDFKIPNSLPEIVLSAEYELNGENKGSLSFGKNGTWLGIKCATPALLSTIKLLIDGSKTYDPDQFKISEFQWSSPNSTIANGNQNSIEFHFDHGYGVYLINLEVYDMQGGVSQRTISVLLSRNVNPVADVSSTATNVGFGPLSRIVLDASSSSDDDAISSYQWTLDHFTKESNKEDNLQPKLRQYLKKIGLFEEDISASDTQPQIASSNSRIATVTNIYPGKYTFKLIVTDTEGLTDSAFVQVIVDYSSFEEITSGQALEPVLPKIWYTGRTELVEWNALPIDMAKVGVKISLLRKNIKKPITLTVVDDGSSSMQSRNILVPTNLDVPDLYKLKLQLMWKDNTYALPIFGETEQYFAIRKRYNYVQGSWTSCHGQCDQEGVTQFQGVIQRDVKCIEVDTQTYVELSTCQLELNRPPPVATQVCVTTCASTEGSSQLKSVAILSPWSTCSGTCDNGVQSRQESCVEDGTFKTLPMSSCDHLELPPLSQGCALPTCKVQYFLKDFHQSDDSTLKCMCRNANEGITPTESVHCVNSLSKVPLSKAKCGVSDEEDHVLDPVVPCSLPTTCNDVFWAISDWSSCSHTCGASASATRSVQCYDKLIGQPVADSFCSHLGKKPVSIRACNQGVPCKYHTWWVSAWKDCSSSTCGTQTRDVKCLEVDHKSNGKRSVVANSLCSHLTKPQHSVACGSSCTLSDLLQGVDRSRCARDVYGSCCNGGVARLNKCGICGGTSSAVVDGLGKCCVSGVLDASSMCCESGQIDACGVCDGTDKSCSQKVLYHFDPSTSDMNELKDSTQAQDILTHEISTKLQLKPSRMRFQSIETKQSQGRGLQQTIPATAYFVVLPNNTESKWLTSLEQSVRDQSSMFSFGLKEPLCGNGICEVGEACDDSDGSATCCSSDCTMGLPSCPVDRFGNVCGGNGICLASSNQCSCFEKQGYHGLDCTQCQPGWIKLTLATGDLVCAPSDSMTAPTTTDTPTTSPTTTASPTLPDVNAPNSSNISENDGLALWPLILGGSLAGFGLLLCIGVFAWYRRRERKRNRLARTKVVVDNYGPHFPPMKEPQHSSVLQQGPPVPPPRRVFSSPSLPVEPAHLQPEQQLVVPNSMAPPGIHQEGWLKMCITGPDEHATPKWDTLYFVLYKEFKHLTYYMGMSKSSRYNVYTGELGSISLNNLYSVRTSNNPRYEDRVFELCLKHPNGRGVTAHLFMCESSESRLRWVDALSHYVTSTSHKNREDFEEQYALTRAISPRRDERMAPPLPPGGRNNDQPHQSLYWE